MVERYCALTICIIYLVVGLAGFTPALVSIRLVRNINLGKEKW